MSEFSDAQLEYDKKMGLTRGLALMYWESNNDVGCLVCGHFCDQTNPKIDDDPVTCGCKCHLYLDDSDLIVGEYNKTMIHKEALGGRGWAITKTMIHDKETNCTEIKGDGKKHEPFVQHVDDGRGGCLFCSEVTQMRAMLDLVGPAIQS